MSKNESAVTISILSLKSKLKKKIWVAPLDLKPKQLHFVLTCLTGN